MENVINVAKMLFMRDLPHEGAYFDFTLRDGYDTLYMAKYASEGNVFSFECQESNMENVYRLLEKNFQDNVHIVRDNSLDIERYARNGINGFIIDTTHITMSADMLIKLVESAVTYLKIGGRGLIIVGDERDTTLEDSKNDERISSFGGYVSKLSRDKLSVIEMTEANTYAPTAYIIEKIR